MDLESIRLLIRDKLDDGRLPHDSVTKAWGGPSDGEVCSVCDTVLAVNQLVMEGTTRGRRQLQFHVRCSRSGKTRGARRVPATEMHGRE
jgi:hypothetical protein